MTALTITSRLRKRMISENMAIPKKTVRTRLYRCRTIINFKPCLQQHSEPEICYNATNQNGLRDSISKRNKKDFKRKEKVEILLEFKKEMCSAMRTTRVHKWRNYAVYGLLTLSQLSNLGFLFGFTLIISVIRLKSTRRILTIF